MFDLARTVHDVVIVDDPDSPPSLSLDEEEDMPHLIIEGERHKMALDHARSACGLEWHAGRTPFVEVATWKDGALLLCTECFPRYERDQAAAHQERERRESGEYETINIREWLTTPPAGTAPRKKR